MRWLGQRRRWNVPQATTVFTVAAVVATVALSIYVADSVLPRWHGVDRAYERIGRWMEQEGVDGDAVVMVNNPPAFWYYTRRPSVVVPAPAGDLETLLAAAYRYDVAYVVLDRNWPLPSEGLSHPQMQQVAEWGKEASRVVLCKVVAR